MAGMQRHIDQLPVIYPHMFAAMQNLELHAAEQGLVVGAAPLWQG